MSDQVTVNNTTNNTRNGLGVSSLLGVAFIILKILGKITWPWIWVTAPLWIPWAFVIVVLVIFLLIYLAAIWLQ